MRRRTRMLGGLLALLLPLPAAADAAGDQILEQAEEHTLLGYNGSESEVELVLTNKRGTVRTRKIVIIAEEREGLSRALVRFLAPPDVAGTGFLVRERKDADDDQFLYVPALKKVRRISASQKGSSFMGTDLAYDDLQSHEVRESTNTVLREEAHEGHACWVLESIPKPEADSLYSRAVRWVRKKDHVPLRMELYDKGDPRKLLKVMQVFQVGKKAGRVIIRDAQMENVVKKHTTRFKLTRIALDQTFSDADFSKQALEKGR